MTVYLQDADLTLYHGDALETLQTLPAASVNCCITSPPYLGLRDYGTGTWGGGNPADCDHLNHPGAATGNKGAVTSTPMGDVCGRCGARRVDHQLGLEQTPAAYVAALVAVFREVRRVLADDGVMFLNLGDSYANLNHAPGTTAKVNQREGWGDIRLNSGSIPPGLKPKDLVGIPWRSAFALQADGWWLRSDIVWCLSGGTRLYARTQKGDMPASLKDLARLDPSTVKLWNGERWTQVLGWHRAESRGDPVEIVLASGERIGCTPGHVWPTQRGNVRADQLVAGDVLQTTRLPQPAAPTSPRFLPDAEVGWLVGRYLADGSTSGDTVQLACHTDEADGLSDRAGSVAVALHGSAVIHRLRGKGATVNLNGPLTAALIRGYIHGSNAKTKGLRSRVWSRSDEFLRALLIGYLEGDGHYDEKNDRWRLGFTRNDRLADDIRTLAARLGLPLRLAIGTTTGFGKTWPIYRGQIRITAERLRQREYGKVVAVRRSKGREFWDVEVADDPHLFALGSGVLTHNSKPNPMPESVTDRPTKAHEYVFLLSKQPRYWFDADAIREPAEYGRREWGDGRIDYDGGTTGVRRKVTTNGGDPSSGRNVRSVWSIPTQSFEGAHFATFPEELVRRCLLAGCPEWVCGTCYEPRRRLTESRSLNRNELPREHPEWRPRRYDNGKAGDPQSPGAGQRFADVSTVGWSDCGHGDNWRPGTVLDPFFGSGTTGLVARKHGRRTVGIELSADYCELAARRLQQLSLLAEQGAA